MPSAISRRASRSPARRAARIRLRRRTSASRSACGSPARTSRGPTSRSRTTRSPAAPTNPPSPIVDKPHFSPSVVKAPVIAGTLTTGRQLTADIGTFSGDLPIQTTFVWERCDATGADCHVIVNAKKVVYFPTSSDVGFSLRVAVTATNAYGKSVVLSPPTDAVSASPPHIPGRRIVGTSKGEYLAGGGQ